MDGCIGATQGVLVKDISTCGLGELGIKPPTFQLVAIITVESRKTEVEFGIIMVSVEN